MKSLIKPQTKCHLHETSLRQGGPKTLPSGARAPTRRGLEVRPLDPRVHRPERRSSGGRRTHTSESRVPLTAVKQTERA